MSHVLHPPSSRKPTARTTARGRTHTPSLHGSDVEPLATRSPLALQRLAGNRATALLLQRAPGDESDEEAAPHVAADDAARAIIAWLTTNGGAGQQVNYCVGTLPNGDLVISKVNGVTEATDLVANRLGPYIQENQLHDGRDIFLAQKFNTDAPSNHAEMCILAAAPNVTKIYCTGPHCGFCAAVMTARNVALGAGTGGSAQMGWTHPFRPIAYGSQSGATDLQLAELVAIESGQPSPGATQHHTRLTKASNGRMVAWL